MSTVATTFTTYGPRRSDGRRGRGGDGWVAAVGIGDRGRVNISEDTRHAHAAPKMPPVPEACLAEPWRSGPVRGLCELAAPAEEGGNGPVCGSEVGHHREVPSFGRARQTAYHREGIVRELKLYHREDYQALREAMNEDPSAATIVADWLEDHGFGEYAAHLRAGRTCPAKLDDGDWAEAFGFAGEKGTCNNDVPKATPPGSTVPAFPYTRQDVRRVIAMQDGENDGPDWVIVGELWDGRFFSLRGGCDYTGWD